MRILATSNESTSSALLKPFPFEDPVELTGRELEVGSRVYVYAAGWNSHLYKPIHDRLRTVHGWKTYELSCGRGHAGSTRRVGSLAAEGSSCLNRASALRWLVQLRGLSKHPGLLPRRCANSVGRSRRQRRFWCRATEDCGIPNNETPYLPGIASRHFERERAGSEPEHCAIQCDALECKPPLAIE
jgi:hypothetical protein